MRFLISNYSTPWFTEPYYFNAGLNLLAEGSSFFLDNQRSIYDNFDRFKPDVFITHASQMNGDIIHYLKNAKNIKLVISVKSVDDENINKVSEFLKSQNIDHILFGDRDLTLESKFVKIPEAADIFLQYSEPVYSIDKLIFIDKPEDITDTDLTCHYTSNRQELNDTVDFMLPINGYNAIFKNYDEIVFKGDSFIGSQISFNAIYSCTKVVFDTKDPNNLDKISNIFKNQKLLSSVKNKHTGLHRLKTLLNFIQCSDLAKKLESEIEKL